MLTASNITLTRGNHTLLQNYNLTLKAGDLYVITGPNGTGKTSLLRALCGLCAISAGTITRTSDINFIAAHELPLDTTTPYMYLTLQAALADVPYALPHDPFGITPHLHTPLHRLSTGWRQRAKLTRLLLIQRDIWLLDEPTAGLDAHSVTVLKTLIENHQANGGSLIIASHQPELWPNATLINMGGT